MRYNKFTSRFSRLALLMLLIAGTISANNSTAPAHAAQDSVTCLPIVMRDSMGGTPLPPVPTAQQSNRRLIGLTTIAAWLVRHCCNSILRSSQRRRIT